MMLNDATWEMADIDKIPQQDSIFNDIRIVVTLPYHLITKLSVSYKENPEIIKKIVEDYIDNIEIQHHTSSLLFDGREPRKDVLNKLLVIAKALEMFPQFPRFHRDLLERIIRRVLKNQDPRTIKKYLNCVKGFVDKSSGTRVTAYNPYDLFHFKNAVEAKLIEKE